MKKGAEIISKDEVVEIVEQMYNFTIEQCSFQFLMKELRHFCDLVEDAVMSADGKPFELNYDEDYYITKTIVKEERQNR